MKKVGIITYRDIADGKGRFLQAYALYSAIQDMGYSVEIIDYYPINSKLVSENKFNKVKRILLNPKDWSGYLSKLKNDTMSYIYKDQFIEKRAKYCSFIESNIRVTVEQYFGYESLLKGNFNYDAYVCGSDQIWNPNFQGLDPAYYLKFVPNSKRIAYAPSLGTTEISDIQKKIIKENLDGMSYISVREKSGAEIIKSITGKDVKNVIDPTLLMSRDWWLKFAGEEVPKKPYVLTFLFDNNKYPRRMAEQIAKRYGYDLISIPDSFADLFFRVNKEISIGPERFVNLFKNASFVCTQSFHGVILSLIYSKPFFVFIRDTKGSKTSIFSRISDLLKMVGLEERIVKAGSPIQTNIMEIDFNNVNSILEMQRKECTQFLKDALYKAIGGKDNDSIT